MLHLFQPPRTHQMVCQNMFESRCNQHVKATLNQKLQRESGHVLRAQRIEVEVQKRQHYLSDSH